MLKLKIDRLLSVEVQILLKKIKASPELFSCGDSSGWSDLIYFGTFRAHERLVINWVIRKVRLEATKRKIYSLLVD